MESDSEGSVSNGYTSHVKGEPAPSVLSRAYYSATIREFCSASPTEVLGKLALNNEFDLVEAQRDAWLEQTRVLQAALKPHQGRLYLEFTVPRMGSRIDAIAIIGPVLFVLEFKVGETSFHSKDVDQVMDYALDLKNFHEGSHEVVIAPILISTKADTLRQFIPSSVPEDRLLEASRAHSEDLGKTIDTILKLVKGPNIQIEQWEQSGYKPTPTIIEAALALYRNHSVRSITRNDAGAMNLHLTSGTVSQIIESAKCSRQKAICFVTGVPGAGKTLVGLDAAAKHIDKEDNLHTVYLSGNGPLVKILQEVLARDKVRQERQRGTPITMGDARIAVKPIIQNVHHFRDDGLKTTKAPHEHVAVFDEAQRAWNRDMTIDFMRRKKGVAHFDQSEPHFLLSCLDRHKDWAVVVCLVGGGQEINRGEAGIREWLNAIDHHFPDWKVYVSSKLSDREYSAEREIATLQGKSRVEFRPELHLATSMRSFRCEQVSKLVKQVLDLELDQGRETLEIVQKKYPILLTRHLPTARNWLRTTARGTERYGIVASSRAERLRPHAVNVRAKINPVHWFLKPKKDVRSSYYLEDVATEFDVQGLELDYTCVVWDGDFRYSKAGWEYWAFKGHKWQHVHGLERQAYLRNAYRVLLTRARKGMIIVVPEGDKSDPTRHSDYYDHTFDYLHQLGMTLV